MRSGPLDCQSPKAGTTNLLYAEWRRLCVALMVRTVMHISLSDAIKIHARVSRTRFGRAAKKRALKTAQNLRRGGDSAGATVWEQLAAEIDRSPLDRGNVRVTAAHQGS